MSSGHKWTGKDWGDDKSKDGGEGADEEKREGSQG